MKTKKQRILVPIDFTSVTPAVVEKAIYFAKQHSSEIILLYVAEVSHGLFDIFGKDETENKLRDAAAKHIGKYESQVSDAGIHATTVISTGKVYDQIVEQADELQAELIVMGAYGENTGKHQSIGSNTSKVLRMTEVPVISVKHSPKATKIEKILVPVDPEFSIKELRNYLMQYNQVFNPYIDLLTIFSEDEDEEETRKYLTRQKETLDKQGLKFATFHIIRSDSISRGIVDFAEENNFDMIWMETHGRTGLSGLFLSSVTEEVIHYSRIPVLSIKPEFKGNRSYYSHPNLPV